MFLALPSFTALGCSKALEPEETKLTSCVERPDTLARPPSGELPCELIAPGLEFKSSNP